MSKLVGQLENKISKLNFKGKWRTYQQRVLNELNEYLDDSKLNVVAAPGAGKTILGIEVLKRLNKPALILAPTITIKNQWKQRIIDNFLEDKDDIDWISVDIKNVSTITVSTYQGLHSLWRDEAGSENFIKQLKKNNIQTLVLDEAHHLRTEWWATLNDLANKLSKMQVKIVSLTATPPYDVSKNEWINYSSLCGSPDAEISIPELVKTGDLCPHQDLIYFSDLSNEEKKIVFDFEQKRKEFFEFINKNSEFYLSILNSSFVKDVENNVEIIYKNTDFTISLISYLLYCDDLNIEARLLCEFLGLDVGQIPVFDYKIAQTFFNNLLFDFKMIFRNEILFRSKLKELKLISKNKADFVGETNFKKLFARSQNKLKAIYDITKFEYEIQKENLREVILLDYIGKGDSDGLNILSVFDKLQSLKIKMGILTGSLMVIPKEAKEYLYHLISDKEKVLTSEFNSEYLRVEIYGNVDIVSIITKLFELGYMNILVGTAALLGEGWDSPSVNTLIIASVVGSFMLSNQMRGRALRVNKNDFNKTSNIWHLVSLDSNHLENEDFEIIKKRFATFEGISYCDNKIQNGIERLNLDYDLLFGLKCKNLNQKSFEYALNRNNLKQKWQQVFEKSVICQRNMVSQIYNVMEGEETQKSVIVKNLPKWLSFAENIVDASSIYSKDKKKNFIDKTILKLLCNCKIVREDWEKILDKNQEIYNKERNFKFIANALLKTLCDIRKIKTNYNKIELQINTKKDSKFYITLFGSSNYERNLFINSLEEVFKVEDNRYILKKGEKYIAVPSCIGTNGKNVDKFVEYLEMYFGYFEKIFTRNPLGYKELLKAKYNTLKICDTKNTRIWL